MTASDPWVLELAQRLATAGPWPATAWADALAPLAGHPDRSSWETWLTHNPGCSPEAFTAARHASDAWQPADLIGDLEALAVLYRRRNGLPPDSPLTIDLGPQAAATIADIAAAEAADYLAGQ